MQWKVWLIIISEWVSEWVWLVNITTWSMSMIYHMYHINSAIHLQPCCLLWSSLRCVDWRSSIGNTEIFSIPAIRSIESVEESGCAAGCAFAVNSYVPTSRNNKLFVFEAQTPGLCKEWMNQLSAATGAWLRQEIDYVYVYVYVKWWCRIKLYIFLIYCVFDLQLSDILFVY